MCAKHAPTFVHRAIVCDEQCVSSCAAAAEAPGQPPRLLIQPRVPPPATEGRTTAQPSQSGATGPPQVSAPNLGVATLGAPPPPLPAPLAYGATSAPTPAPHMYGATPAPTAAAKLPPGSLPPLDVLTQGSATRLPPQPGSLTEAIPPPPASGPTPERASFAPSLLSRLQASEGTGR